MEDAPRRREEVEAEILRLEGDLQDLEEAIQFEYTFTSAHIGGRQVKRDEEDLTRLRLRIAQLRALPGQKEGPVS